MSEKKIRGSLGYVLRKTPFRTNSACTEVLTQEGLTPATIKAFVALTAISEVMRS